MLRIVPISRREAQFFVEQHHRHLKGVTGAVFQLGVANDDNDIVGVAICGRPISRFLDDGWTLEVSRCCTDGTKNACSKLYAACWKVARNLGYRRLTTYTLKTESGASLRGAGWEAVAEVKPDSWNRPARPRIDTNPAQAKIRWETSL